MSYNIHKGIGTDRRYRLERIMGILRRYNPDVAVLQEVDDGVPRSRHDRQVDLLAEALGYAHRAFQRNVHLKIGHYGNAILSRFPLSDEESIDLTVPLKKRRRALVVRCEQHLEGHTRSLLLVNVHLGLAGYERRRQIRRLLKHAALDHARRLPIVIGGDYNDGRGALGRNLLEPAGYRAVSRQIRTFPSTMPMRALDRIYYRGHLDAHHAFAARTRLSRQASDHLPLVVDFEWTG